MRQRQEKNSGSYKENASTLTAIIELANPRCFIHGNHCITITEITTSTQ